MTATFKELRSKTRAIRAALDRNESVTILYRGRPKAILRPIGGINVKPTRKVSGSMKDDPAFGMWKDRQDMKDVAAYVRKLRRGRYRDL